MSTTESASVQNGEPIVRALSQIASYGDKLRDGDPTAREKLIKSARQLVSAAETPVETLLWNTWALPTRNVALRIAIDLKIFETAMSDNGRPKTSEELAAVTAANPTLVMRVARACVSMNMLDEQKSGVYMPNKMTEFLSKPEYQGGIIHCFDSAALSFAQLPSYLKTTGFQNPEDALDGPFQYATKCGSAFTWLSERPENFRAFHAYVHAVRVHRPKWSDIYPVQERLIDGLKQGGGASAFVDIGGGTGQILQDFSTHVPQYGGKLVLQERPEVIAAATNLGVAGCGIELHVHDFFTPQPIKGARAYFMRSVLHDWPDESCRKILGHLRMSWNPVIPRFLLTNVVADQGASWQHVAMDFFMMAQVSAQERTETEWRKLIEGCGLKVSGIYTKGEENEGLIEVVIE
ncbi:S-adenosyl-L-methionine-dependent methyltransferase [Xylaria arbuscula]|nr:S-adenosyl-L-methionine-dependent methyltransferase [Xylaria arbuscula]